MYNYYEKMDLIVSALTEEGFSDLANKIIECRKMAGTSLEAFMCVGHNLRLFLKEKTILPQPLKQEIEDLSQRINKEVGWTS